MKRKDIIIPNKKIDTVTSLTELFTKAKSVAVVDYTKMTVSQATALRKDIKKAGGEMKVTKNTLFKIAAKQKDMKLEGLNAFVFALTDEVSPLKVVADYIKKNNVLSFKAGLSGDRVLTAAETVQLANTPPRETSISKVLYLLNWNMSKLVRTLDAVTKKG